MDTSADKCITVKKKKPQKKCARCAPIHTGKYEAVSMTCALAVIIHRHLCIDSA